MTRWIVWTYLLRGRLTALLPLCLALGYPCSLAAQAGQPPEADTFLAPAGETEINQLVAETVTAGGRGGRGLLKGRLPVVLSNAEALRRALEHNLQIRTRQQDREIAQGVILESKSAFYPVFNLSGAYNRIDTYNRSEPITRDRPTGFNFQGEPAGQTPAVTDEFNITRPRGENFSSFVCVNIDGQLLNAAQCALRTERNTKQEFASVSSPPIEAWDFGLRASQIFPWGSSLQVQIQSTRREKNFYPLDAFGLDQPLSLDDPIGQGSRFPWTSTFSLSFSTPLPYSRNFGPYGFRPNVDLMLSRLGEKQAGWAVAASANEALRAADDAYWELVRAVKQLQIRIEQREVLQALAERAQALFEARTITVYDKAQIDANLENIRNQEEIAWNDYIARSNNLVNLLDLNRETAILPVDYSQVLRDLFRIEDPQPIFETALEQNPEIHVGQLGLEQSQVLVSHRKTQVRPDVSFFAGVVLNQVDQVLGHDSWQDSFGNLFSPDSSDFVVGVNLRIPLGNRAVRSALSQARVRRNQALEQLQLTQNSVVQRVNSVLAVNYSTTAQIAERRASLDLAQLAFLKANDLREQALVSEFERLVKLSELLAARSSYIDALVANRKTRAQLLAAEGVLAAQY
jgi:outer membrane protein TolC